LATLNALEVNADENDEGLKAIIRQSIDFKAGMAFLILMIVYSPCVAAMGTFFSEVKAFKWRLLYLLFPNLSAWLLAFVCVRILESLGY